jgi:purine-binding chemotaxis protein CheW
MSRGNPPQQATSGGSARWDQLARAASQHRDAVEDQESLRQLLAFELDGAPYAIPVECVREIVRIRPITPVPRVPDEVRGVISLRGEIVQVIDVRRRLRLAPANPTRSSRIIVLQDDEGRVAGILVDAVTEVLRLAESAIHPAAAGESSAVESLCKCGERFVSMIDLEYVLSIHAEH